MTTTSVKIFGGLLFSVGALVLLLAAVALKGWALVVLWDWFVVPTFGLPALSLGQAVGIAIISALLTHQYVPSKENDVWLPFSSLIMWPLSWVGLGWIVKSFL